MTADPYASLVSLARGWRARSRDLILRAERLERQAAGEEPSVYSIKGGPPPVDELRTAARHNRTLASAMSSNAAELEDSIDFARRHELGGAS